jgi:hypothetical protein
LKLAHENQNVQTLLFSATLPQWINELTAKYLKPNKQVIDLVQGSDNKTASKITHLAICCPWHQRVAILADMLKVYGGPESKTIVFADTKKDCNEMGVHESLKGCQVSFGLFYFANRLVFFYLQVCSYLPCVFFTGAPRRYFSATARSDVGWIPPRQIQHFGCYRCCSPRTGH